MRCRCFILTFALAACTPDDGVAPVETPLPAVFPPPDQLVDDRSITSLALSPFGSAPDVGPAVDTSRAPEALPVAPRVLDVRLDGGTLMYPTAMWHDGAVSIVTDPAVTAEALRAALELQEAASKEDLVAARSKVVRFDLGSTSSDGPDAGRVWTVRPSTGFGTNQWYRVRVAPGLAVEGVQPLARELVTFVRGPEPLRVTDVACGWPVCTTENPWTVSFNGEIDPASAAGCFRTTPALDLSDASVQGWSVVLRPKSPKVGTTYQLTVSGACRSTTGERLATAHRVDLAVELPRARLSLPAGTGYVAPLPSGESPSIHIGAAYTGKLGVGMTRISAEALPAFLAGNLESWGGFSFTHAVVDQTTTVDARADGESDVKVSLAPALKGERGLVYLHVEAERIGDNDQPPIAQALVQVTDLGLSVKSGPEETLVWVTSLLDHRPVSGVVVRGLEATGETLWTATTDERGMATGAGRREGGEGGEGVTRNTRIVVASDGTDTAFLDLAEWRTRSEPYEFGLPYAWDARANGLRGIVFTERGVYRAGETVHVKGYLRVERGGRLEKVDVPTVALTITNPLGDRALATEVTLGAVGDFQVELPLDAAAALGSWSIDASVPARDDAPVTPVATRSSAPTGNIAGTFRVEAYRPNTFEVKVGGTLGLTSASGGAPVPTITAQATGRYYYGAPMAGAHARWWVQRADASFMPAGYDDFSFEIPSWADDAWEPRDTSVEASVTGEAELDADGSVKIEAPLEALGAALKKGPQNLTLEVEVSDVDQQTVTGRTSLRAESADHYLGVRTDKGFAGTGEPIGIDVIALTPDGAPAIGKPVQLRWVRRTWHSRRVAASGGGITWESERKDEVLATRALTTAATPVRESFTAAASGNYWVEVTGVDGRGRAMSAATSVWVWGDGASWSENDEGHLEIVAAQDDWKVGDTARFVVQSPFASADALITVEANGVVWRDTRKLVGTAPLVEIPVTEAMMPNAFVSVLAIGVPLHPLKPGEAETRMGYVPMKVDTSGQRLSVVVTPDAARHAPGETVSVHVAVRDAAGAPVNGRVTFMAVDEGVLSLTGYQTPDPHKAMFTERSLAIITSEARRQMWSRLVDDEGMKSDWGGGGEGGEATNYRAAFATTAAFMPDVRVDGGEADVSFTLPDNLTTYRLMAVAATEDGRFGKGESKVESNKPLLVRPGLPRFISVGDRFEARAIVQALDPEAAGEVDVELVVSGPVTLEGAGVQRISAGAKATPVVFAARATEPGTATFAFKVTGRGGSGGPPDKGPRVAADAVQIEIPVTWPAATRSAVVSGVVGAEGVAKTTLQIPDWVRDDVGGIDVTLTSTRIGELLPGLDYLLHYPYGCVEQTTGGTLPLLALNELQRGFSLPGVSHDEVLVLAQSGVDRLRSMQTWSGGLGYWPGDTTPHPWGSVYGGMALVRASRIEGLEVPASAIERLLAYLRDILRDQAASAREEWHSEIEVVKPFAAYVLALAGTPEPSFVAALFDKRAELPDFARLLLALAVTEGHGDATMATTLVDEVLKKTRVDGERATLERAESRYWYSTMDSDVRTAALLAMALEAIRPTDPLLPKVQKGLLEARQGGEWMSTQDNAFAILALARTMVASEHPRARFTARVEVDGQVWLAEAMRGDELSPKTVHLPMYVARKAQGKALTIRREGDDAPVYFSMRFDYAPKEIPKAPIARGFELERRYRIANGPRAGQPANDLQAGEVVRVDLRVRTDGNRRYVAIDDPLPAGLEPITLDFATTSGSLAPLADDHREYWVPAVFNHTEQKDDRVVLFSDVMPAGEHHFVYLARATTTGTFLAPAARVHEMYHPDVYGQTAAEAVVVR